MHTQADSVSLMPSIMRPAIVQLEVGLPRLLSCAHNVLFTHLGIDVPRLLRYRMEKVPGRFNWRIGDI